MNASDGRRLLGSYHIKHARALRVEYFRQALKCFGRWLHQLGRAIPPPTSSHRNTSYIYDERGVFRLNVRRLVRWPLFPGALEKFARAAVKLEPCLVTTPRPSQALDTEGACEPLVEQK
jgi:hypothetical protein